MTLVTPPTDGPFLTAEYLQDLLQVSASTLQRMERRGDLPPAIRLGRWKRWRAVDIDLWFDGLSAPVKVEFAQPFGPYQVGERAGFDVRESAILVGAGIATVEDQEQFERVKAVRESFAGSELDLAAGQDEDGDPLCDE